ncbi:MAG: hypothetical protein OXE99_06985 [Cellvibrionales bacterium]|nr:hypothetical protein [Cellvibrionales bacterium]
MLNPLAVTWSILGVSALLGCAIYRLSVHVFALNFSELSDFHWLTLISFSLFMAYSEGYRGFQKGFSPRVAARVRYLKNSTNLIEMLLSPLFVMGFFNTTRRRQITVIVLVIMLALLIQLMHFVPSPWRGIIDTGVVIGLTWGLVSFYYFTWLALTTADFPYSPELSPNK